MRKGLLLIVLTIALILTGSAHAQPKEDIHLHKDCKYCGMDRGSFDFTRMLIEYDDGSTSALCSLHCAAIDLANTIDKTPAKIMVGDFNTKDLIDAEKAFWTVGGTKPGVMSKRGKWAFAKKEDADAFIAKNGGSPATFEEAMKAAYEDLYADTRMIREKRKMKRMKMMEHKR
ncbi:MAG: nitrous oxide reductase accessory protein NosL [Nitrospiraceae bacterium]|nr:nitrous oxide reductase accessory protein NosL [Nitrospiraceae bacterium]